MKELKDFKINVVNLSEGIHQYEFHVEDAFFDWFEHSLTEKGNLNVQLKLEKNSNVIAANFSIKGTVELVCDRSLELYNFPILSEKRILFKYSEEVREDSTDEIIYIPSSEHEYNFAKLCYEFIMLEIPYKKLHPDLEKEDNEEEWESNQKLVYSSANDLSEENEDEEELENQGEIEKIDPRWAALKNLTKNK